MVEVFAIVLFVVVGLGVVGSLISFRGRGDLYDQIGRGGLSLREEPVGPPAAGPATGESALAQEVRQLVIARNERRARAGEPPLDVDTEVQRQLAELDDD
jgi:hypothetical protein